MKKETVTPTDLEVLESLKSVIDPELMVNIVDLGMVYNIIVSEETNQIIVDITFTSRGCPLGDVIKQHALEVLHAQYPKFNSSIHVVWEPAWNPSFITEQGKKELE